MWKGGPKTRSEWYQCIKDGLIICVVHETFKRSSKKGNRPHSKALAYEEELLRRTRMSYEGEKKLQRKRGNEVLVDSLCRQFMHYEDGGGVKPSNILLDQGAGIVGSTRFTPEFVNKYPNMMNGKIQAAN